MRGRSGVGRFFALAGVAFTLLGGVLLVGSLLGGIGLGASITGFTFLTIGIIWTAVGFGLVAWYRRVAARMERERRLFETGERATAVVEGVETTGMVVNDVNAQVRITVRVRPRHGNEFTATRTMLVPFNAMPRPGDLIEVAYDPARPEQLAFEADSRVDTAGGYSLVTRRPEPEAAPAASAPAGPAPTAAGQLLAGLELLQKLRDDGTLTDAEFEAQKAKLLAGGQ